MTGPRARRLAPALLVAVLAAVGFVVLDAPGNSATHSRLAQICTLCSLANASTCGGIHRRRGYPQADRTALLDRSVGSIAWLNRGRYGDGPRLTRTPQPASSCGRFRHLLIGSGSVKEHRLANCCGARKARHSLLPGTAWRMANHSCTPPRRTPRRGDPQSFSSCISPVSSSGCCSRGYGVVHEPSRRASSPRTTSNFGRMRRHRAR